MRWQLGTVRGMMESDLVRALGLGGAGGSFHAAPAFVQAADGSEMWCVGASR